MDPSALIFVALAVAWAAYLVPKAVRHHDEAARSRSVERFSETMRVLARREPVGGSRESRMVLSPGRPAATTVVVTKERERSVSIETSVAPVAAQARPATSRAAAARAAARRRRVLLAIAGAILLIAGVVAAGFLAWVWLAAPVVVLLAWLVTCRVAVRAETGLSAASRERRLERRDARLARRDARLARRDARLARRDVLESSPADEIDDRPAVDEAEHTEEIARVVADTGARFNPEVPADQPARPGVWDPVPVTLPTYVDKEQATRRTVRTIDLESTGVWTSGRSESDSALAREAEETERAERTRESDRAEQQRRATGS